MTELTDLSDTDASNTVVTGQSTEGNTANMGGMDNLFQATLGMLSRFRNSNIFRLRDNTDKTKLLAFDLSGLTTATTRTLTISDASGTVITTTDAASQTALEGEAAVGYVRPSHVKYSPGAAKAWGVVTVTGGSIALDAGYNVASVAAVVTGRIEVNLTVAFSSANYVVVVSGMNNVSAEETTWYTIDDSNTFTISHSSGSGTLSNPLKYSFVCYGDF